MTASRSAAGQPRNASSSCAARVRPDEVARQQAVERRQRDRSVAQHFDRHAAEAERQHRTEVGIARKAAQQLAAVRPAHERLHQHADELRLRHALGELHADGLESLHDGGIVGDIEQHAADVGLVRDATRQHLEHDRIADAPGGAHRIVGARREQRARDRQAETREQLLASASSST